MKKIDIKKIGLALEIVMFAVFTFDFIVYLIKFLRAKAIITLANTNMNNMIKVSIVLFFVLCFVLIVSIILRIVLAKIQTKEETEAKTVLSRTIVAGVIFVAIIAIMFYWLCVHQSGYTVLEYINTLK